MKPERVSFHVYADSPEEVARLERGLYRFISSMYESGILVTAGSLADALDKFGGSFLVRNYFRGHS